MLVVDDEPGDAGLIAFCRKRIDHRARGAADTNEGLDEFGREPPDVRLLDLRLPGLIARELLREIRRRPRFASLPVVVMSARRELEDRLNADRLGAVDYITEPFSRSDLVPRIHTVFGPVPEPDRKIRDARAGRPANGDRAEPPLPKPRTPFP